MDALQSAIKAITVPIVAKVNWKELFADVHSLASQGVDPLEAVGTLPIGKYIDVHVPAEGEGDGGVASTELA